MKVTSGHRLVWLVAGLLLLVGCTPLSPVSTPSDDQGKGLGYQVGFAPAKINIIPLTEYVKPQESGQSGFIKVYISVLDEYGSQIKTPGTFRFELCERELRSVDPKGKRIIIWPDLDLTEAKTNNRYWRDFLRTYEFHLDVNPAGRDSVILDATFITPEGKRISIQQPVSMTGEPF